MRIVGLENIENVPLKLILRSVQRNPASLAQDLSVVLRAEEQRRQSGGRAEGPDLPLEVASVEELEALERAFRRWRLWIARFKDWPGALDFCAHGEFVANAFIAGRRGAASIH